MSAGERFVAEVVDVENDSEQSGRVQVRVFGDHDDQMLIPDELLPWARCVFPVTNALHGGAAGATTGLVKGSTVVGYYADDDKTILLVDGVIGKTTSTKSDFLKVNSGEDHNEVIDANIFHVGTADIKFALSKTIGNINYVGQSVDDLMQAINEGHISSIIANAKNVLSSVRQLKHQLIDAPIEQVNSIISGFQADLEGLITDEAEQLITGDVGQIMQAVDSAVDTVSDIAGTIGGAKLKDQVQSVTGVIFTNPRSQIGSIATRISKKTIGNASDAINRMSGNKFVMNHQMKSFEQSLSALKKVVTSVR